MSNFKAGVSRRTALRGGAAAILAGVATIAVAAPIGADATLHAAVARFWPAQDALTAAYNGDSATIDAAFAAQQEALQAVRVIRPRTLAGLQAQARAVLADLDPGSVNDDAARQMMENVLALAG